MKSLLQFFLLIALVLIGKQVKQQARPSAVNNPATPARQQVDSIHSFFVQNVNYKPVSNHSAEVSRYERKTSTLSFN